MNYWKGIAGWRTFTTLILLFGASQNLTAQASASGQWIEIAQDYELGKTYRYEIRKQKQDPKLPQFRDMQGVTVAELSVIDENDSQKTCTWKYHPTRIEGIDTSLLDIQTRKLLSINAGFKLVFHVDESGMLTELINFNEVQELLFKKFDTVFTVLMGQIHAAQKLTDTGYSEVAFEREVKKVLEKMSPTWSTPEMMLRYYFPELQQMHLLYGAEFHSDSSYAVEVQVPNPFGGEAFPGIETYQLVNISGNTTEIHVVQNLDEERYQEILAKTFRELGMKDSDKLPVLNIVTKNTYHFDYLDNIMLGYDMVKKVEVDDVLTVETTQIKLLP